MTYTSDPSQWLPHFPHFTAVLLSHSARWEHIRLIIPWRGDLLWIEGSFPLLHHLTLGPYDYHVAGGETAATLFRNAPQLKSVVLGDTSNPSRLVLPWSQLTSITVQALCPSSAADILQQATALVDLTCALRNDEALRHLTISELGLGDEPISTITSFLSRSRCSLQSLHVSQAGLLKAAYCAAFPSIPIIHLNIDARPD
ncbi:hypothetical protein C8J57DRAFT_1241713 [Mycena rebaudengoi]|nr:hypothetical protein C8J57DRAFT_1241713 [Mycena rebaudengoi]